MLAGRILLIRGIQTNWHANEAWFFDQNNGIVVGSNTNGILRTTDGGETFDTLRILLVRTPAKIFIVFIL